MPQKLEHAPHDGLVDFSDYNGPGAHEDAYSVEHSDFGAVAGPLATSLDREQNAANIQGCIDAAWAGALTSGMGATVNVPGFYEIGTPLVHRLGVRMLGNGFITGASGLQQYGSGPVIALDTAATTALNGLEVAHLKLIGNLEDTATGDGIAGIETPYGSTSCHWHDLRITKCGRDGMRFVQSLNTPIFGPVARANGTATQNTLVITGGTANRVIAAETVFDCDGHTYTVNGTPVTLDANGGGTLTLTGALATSPSNATITFTVNVGWHQWNTFERIFLGDGSSGANACQGHAFYAEGGFSTNTFIDPRCMFNVNGIKLTSDPVTGLWMPISNIFITPIIQGPNPADSVVDAETHGIDLYDCHATTIINPFFEAIGVKDTTAASSCIHQDGAKSSGLNIVGGVYSESPNMIKIDDGGGVSISGVPVYHWNGSNPAPTPTFPTPTFLNVSSDVDAEGVVLASPAKKLSAALTHDITPLVDPAGRVVDLVGGRVGRSANRFDTLSTDFMQFTSTPPWTGGAIASGTVANAAGTAAHPGEVRLTSSASANSGYYYAINVGGLVLGGGETCEVIFRPIAAGLATLVALLGIHNNTLNSTDGAWLEFAGATLSGKTNDNTGADTTGTTYTVTAAVWYRGKIVVNFDATRVDFYLYTCADGLLVWSDYLTTKITTTRTTGCTFSATSTGTSAVALMDIDYASLAIDRTLVR